MTDEEIKVLIKALEQDGWGDAADLIENLQCDVAYWEGIARQLGAPAAIAVKEHAP